MSETVDRLKDLLVTRLRLTGEAGGITEDTPFFGPDGLGLDSIDVLELIVGIKKEFGVDIEDREIAEKVFVSVGILANYIEENR